MSDLVAFLKARLDEDEAAAKAVAPLGHTTDMGGTRLDEKFSHARIRFASEDGRSRLEPDAAAGRHFARHDPARVLREVAFKRAILGGIAGAVSIVAVAGTVHVDNWVLRNLAAVYSDHPDYDPEWKA